MLLVLEIGAVPVLEELAEAFVVLRRSASSARPCSCIAYLLLKAIELNDTRCPLQNLDFVALGRSTPLGTSDVALIKGEGFTAARGLPAQARLGKSAFAAVLGQVQIDVVETLAAALVSLCSKYRNRQKWWGVPLHCRHNGIVVATIWWGWCEVEVCFGQSLFG